VNARTNIASAMVAPCSATSMLSASLRPGPWPGLRAWTSPARGSDPHLRDVVVRVRSNVHAELCRQCVHMRGNGGVPVAAGAKRSRGLRWSCTSTIRQAATLPSAALYSVGAHSAIDDGRARA